MNQADPGQRIILHVDMDSFYASVEVREHPWMAGKPVIVGADPKQGTGRGVVCTCSYEARKFGIHSAMPVSHAFHLCPHAIFIRPDFPSYLHSSEKVMEILAHYAPRYEQVSIDEAYLDLSHLGSYQSASETAFFIKSAIREKEALTCSIGIGPSKMVAKIASDMHKPDGLTIIKPSEVEEVLFPLSVMKIPGIGKKTGKELHNLGITTIGDLAAADIQELISHFGRWAIVMQDLARGNDAGEVQQREGPGSISREITFEEDTADMDLLYLAMDTLSADISGVMRDEGLFFRTISVKVRYRGFITRTKSRTLAHSCNDPGEIRRTARELLDDLCTGRKIRLLGVRLSNIAIPDGRQKKIEDFFP